MRETSPLRAQMDQILLKSTGYARVRSGMRRDLDDPDFSKGRRKQVPGVLASLAEFESELGRERRAAAKAARKARDLPIGRFRVLSADEVALAERMRAGGERVPVIPETLGVSRAALYCTSAERDGAR